jgi:hypothetical protein
VTETTSEVQAGPALEVALADGEGANIVAQLLKQHIEGIVAAAPAKAGAARKIKGKLGIHSTEPDARVTLVFDGQGVVIKNDWDADLDGRITGPLKLQTETLAGQANPYREMLRGKMKVGVKLTRPLFTLTTYNFLKVPRPAPRAQG